MAFQSFGPMLIAEDLLEDRFGTLSRAWERDAKGGIHPIFLRRFAPKLCVPPVLEALQRSAFSLDLPGACGGGHQFGSKPKPHWKVNHRQGRSIRRLQEKCREESFPFGLSQALNVAWNLAHACARFWRRGQSVGAIGPDSVRVDFEGGLFLPDLGWMPTLIDVADAHPPIRADLPDLPSGPQGGLEEEARRFGALLYELITFEPLPVGVRAGTAIAQAQVWTPEGPEPLPGPVREGLARLLGDPGQPFETLEGALKQLEALVFDDEEGPSTFNLAHLMHTLFRREYDRQRDLFAQELEALHSSDVWGSDRPPAANQPGIPVRTKSYRGVMVAGTLVVVGLGAGVLMLVRDQERSRRTLQEELVRLQTEYAQQVQQGADAAAIEKHQRQLKEDLEKLAQTARNAEERSLVGQEIERLKARPAAETLTLLATSQATTPSLAERPATEIRPVPVPSRPEPAAAAPAALRPAAAAAPSPAVPRAAVPGPAPQVSEAPGGAQDRAPQVVALQRFAWPAGAARTPLYLRVFVHEDGHPLRATAAPGSTAPPEVIAAAVDAAMKSKYTPALRVGKPARDWVQVQFNP